ncbi:MAG: hypothetical protein HYY48_06270 [Gammaproteobacteria bacterium]|nr:hypothetical protein [Gammaproteobacteria bacterium]
MKWSGSESGDFDEAAVAGILRTFSFLTPPIRPSGAVIAEFRRHFEAAAGRPTLIYGATPELVDLANDLGCPQVVSLDWNADTFEAMRRIARTDWSGVIFRHGNWTIPEPEFRGRFGCVACDGGPLFLRYPDQWRTASEAAYGYLDPGGRWVSRAVDWPAEDPPFDACLRRYVDEFLAKQARLDAEGRLAAFKSLTVEIRVRSFQRVVGENFSIDQRKLARRNDEAARILFAEFPEPRLREIAEMNLLRLARPDPQQSELVSIVPPGAARRTLEDIGFVTEVTDLKAAVPACDYVLAGIRS